MGLRLTGKNRGAAVCLCSGGMDSTVVLYYAIREGYEPYALTVHYGQLHEREIRSACEISQAIGVIHEVISIELPWGGSSLLDPHLAIPKREYSEVGAGRIPSTYVPARNTIFLSLASSFAEAKGAGVIFIGANAVDYSGYPDCRAEYLRQFEHMIRLGTKAGAEGKELKIMAPLIHMKKSEIVKLGMGLGVPFESTWSCYEGGEVPCGRCDACILRAKGFQEAGVEDPIFKRSEVSKSGN